MRSQKNDAVEKKVAQELLKRPYSTPQLTIHGTVEKITGGGAVGAKESLTSAL